MTTATLEIARAASGPGPATVGAAADGRRVRLPGGLVDDDGNCLRDVVLRELTGADEELLCGRFESGARQVSAFLGRAIGAIEGWTGDVDDGLAARLLVGDRDYLLLRLRQIEVGDSVHQVVRCRAPSCGKRVDVDFLISELPLRRAPQVARAYSVALADEQGTRRAARLRLPTGADVEAIAPLVAANPGAANTRLYARIVESIEGYDVGNEESVRALPLRIRSQLASFVARTAPGPDLLIEVACPYCAADLTYPFDLPGFFLPSEP
jgi:hypothetical protein